MNVIIDGLGKWGCDIGGALARFIGDEELYTECLFEFAKDAAFSKLAEAIENGDADVSFDCAHTLKGVAANLGLTPMLERISALVELLRTGSMDGAGELYAALMDTYGVYTDLLNAGN